MAATFIHPTADVSPKAKIGAGTKIWNQAQVREKAVIGRNCIIAKNAYIDAGVHIGSGVKIQNNVSVYHPARIEDDVFIGPAATFTNDKTPRAFLWNESRRSPPTTLHTGASIGANATLVCGITVGKYAMVAAGAVVTKNVPPHGLVMGVPARLSGFVCRCGRRMALRAEGRKKCAFYCEACRKATAIARADYLQLP